MSGLLINEAYENQPNLHARYIFSGQIFCAVK
jgi:hypothetical protein